MFSSIGKLRCRTPIRASLENRHEVHARTCFSIRLSKVLRAVSKDSPSGIEVEEDPHTPSEGGLATWSPVAPSSGLQSLRIVGPGCLRRRRLDLGPTVRVRS